MKSGLYAIASLDGAPLSPIDCHTLGLCSPPGEHARHLDGFSVRAVDGEEHGRAVDFAVRGDCLAVLLGHLDEPDELARSVDLEPRASPAEIALAALERFGDDAPSAMLGEWALLCWRAPRRELTLLVSEACRDLTFFTTDGRRVAVSPELRRLSTLDWVGRAFDPAGLLLQLSRARLRRIMTGETVLRGARRVVPGTREVFAAGERSTSVVRTPVQPDAWHGSFEEGVAALDAILHRIMRQHLQRYGTVAFLLSGGLDSSLLGWLGSRDLGVGQRMFFLTSVAPAGSGLPDEREFSQAVAQRLGLPVTFVCPPESASVYTPSARMFAHNELPVVSPRHYLYDALYGAALAGGATAVFDGVYGELTLTNKLPWMTSHTTLRQKVREARTWWRDFRDRQDWPAGGFHARLSQHALASLPPGWAREWRAPFAPDPAPRVEDLWGFRPAIRKNVMTPTSAACRPLRHLIPFRDRRLLRLAAAMPASFMCHGGMRRALARTLLKDQLPDSVRLRESGRPFSPDFMQRLRTQAPLALARMDLFRAAGAGEWLDLPWLAEALARAGKRGPANIQEAFEVQVTAIAAEFFVWWKTGEST